jgi:hypothetical protein
VRRADVVALLRGHGLPSAGADLSLELARDLVAREHWFPTWEQATARGDERVDPSFEAAADAIVQGDFFALRGALASAPHLVSARSAYGHRATLLHHVTANGVEHTRQRSPANAPRVARLLLDEGAEADSRCESYGGATTLELLVTSSPPAAAGVQEDLVDVLCRGGAAANGPDDDGGPLWSAITWGYTRAAQRLVACGARVDNAVFAAVLGDVEDVEPYFEFGRLGKPNGPSADRVGVRGPALETRSMLEYALVYASLHGRSQAVRFLLSKNPDLAVREPVHGVTAIDAARIPHPAAGRPRGSPEVLALLEEALASEAAGAGGAT